MKLQRFKERDNKRIGIIVFTIACILLVSGVILYRTFAIFEVKTNQNVINGQVQDMGDLEFVFYKDDVITKNVPTEKDYAFDSSKSYCIERSTGNQVSNVSWNSNKSTIELNDVSELGKVKCYIYFNKIYQEEELHGAIPDLGNGRLVPITLNETGQAIKANILDKENPWYSYQNKEWANAIILRDGLTDNYKPGDAIPESDIESYFVWIPRYSYQIFNDEVYEELTQQEQVTKAQTIEIKFENKNMPIQKGSKNTEWLTHPAFTAFDTNGFWVGKFETGYNGAATTAEAQHNEQSVDKLIIKPNVYSWRNIQVANAFYTSYKYQRELDSHLIKNTEWGAVAYLSHSKYGYADNISPNLNTTYLTGYENTSNQWNSQEGQKASNIQNITGIYDMSGGAWEYVAGVMKTENNEYITGENEKNNSGFVGIYGSNGGRLTDEGLPWKEKRYYDFYEYNSSYTNYSKRILGDATGELGPFYQTGAQLNSWYNTHSYFIFNGYPWFIRGSSFASHVGTNYSLFDFSDHSGSENNMISFRVILTP